MIKQFSIALVGNPNCGKTTIFNALTGSYQPVGNWSGVTVDSKSGYWHTNKHQVEIIDLPGTYSLTTMPQEGPEDEAIAANYLRNHSSICVLNVVDVVNIDRHLYLSMQLLEQNVPLIIVLNRMDLLKNSQESINITLLMKALGCPVVPLVAREGAGIPVLDRALEEMTVRAKPFTLLYPPVIEEQLGFLSQVYCKTMEVDLAPRFQLLRWLEGEPVFCALPMAKQITQAQRAIVAECGQEADILIATARFNFIEQLMLKIRTPTPNSIKKSPFEAINTTFLDKFICHRYLGLPIFLAVMYALFFFAINIGGIFQDFFEIVSNALFVEGLMITLQDMNAPYWLMALFVSGVGKGLSTILTFVPVIGAMFLALAFLEDCGYMARAAFVMDRLMRAIGLPGKSFVPLIIGFGCNVPAIMGTRTLDHKRERILTVMMSPFMSCGARLAIFTVFVAAFFPQGGQNIVFLLYLIGITLAVATGLLLKKTLLKGKVAPLVLEMPQYQWPHWRSLGFHCWHRLRRFIINAGKLILPVCICVGVLNSVSMQGQWLENPDQSSLLSHLGQKMVPIFSPLGVEEENWPATVGLLTGILAKEVVIGTLNSLYTSSAEMNETQLSPFSLSERFKEASKTIVENIIQLKQAWRNPIASKMPELNLSHHAYGEMVKRFNGQANAFAYLLFVLLYFPCVSATAAMIREVQKGWTIFSICWTTGLAYAVAVMYYQIATFMDHPLQSVLWLSFCLSNGAFVLVGIRYYSRTHWLKAVPTPIVVC